MMAGETQGTATWDSLEGPRLPAMAVFGSVPQPDGMWVLLVAQVVCTGNRDLLWVVDWPAKRQR